jgi:hypothetical protein
MDYWKKALFGLLFCLTLTFLLAVNRPYHISVDEGYYLSQAYAFHYSDHGDYRTIFPIHNYFYPAVLGLVIPLARFIGIESGTDWILIIRFTHMFLSSCIAYIGILLFFERIHGGSGIPTAILTLTSPFWLLYSMHVLKDQIAYGFFFLGIYFILRQKGQRDVFISSTLVALSWYCTTAVAPLVLSAMLLLVLRNKKVKPIFLFIAVQSIALVLVGIFDYMLFGTLFYSFIRFFNFNLIDQVPQMWINRNLHPPWSYLFFFIWEHKLPTIIAFILGFAVFVKNREKEAKTLMTILLPFLTFISLLYLNRLRYYIFLNPFVMFFSVYLVLNLSKNNKFRIIFISFLLLSQVLLLPPFFGGEKKYLLLEKSFPISAERIKPYILGSHPYNSLFNTAYVEESPYSCIDLVNDFKKSVKTRDDEIIVTTEPCMLPIFAFHPNTNILFRTGMQFRTQQGVRAFKDLLDETDYIIFTPSTSIPKGIRLRQYLLDRGDFRNIRLVKSKNDTSFRLMVFKKTVGTTSSLVPDAETSSTLPKTTSSLAEIPVYD